MATVNLSSGKTQRWQDREEMCTFKTPSSKPNSNTSSPAIANATFTAVVRAPLDITSAAPTSSSTSYLPCAPSSLWTVFPRPWSANSIDHFQTVSSSTSQEYLRMLTAYLSIITFPLWWVGTVNWSPPRLLAAPSRSLSLALPLSLI